MPLPFKLVNRLSGKVLDAELFNLWSGGRVQLWDDYGSEQANQYWALWPTGTADVWTVRSLVGPLDLGADGAEGSDCKLHSSVDRSTLAQWRFVQLDGVHFKVINVTENKVLDADLLDLVNGCKIQLWEDLGPFQQNQHWMLMPSPFAFKDNGHPTEPQPDWQGAWHQLNAGDQGGQGAVFKVRNKIDGTIAALKVMHPDGTKERRARFAREVQALSKVSIPGVPKILESNVPQTCDGVLPANLYLVEEWLEGPTLSKVVSSGPLTIERAAKITRAICDIISVCHANDVVHRDIKPDNILLIHNDTPFVVDFGQAYLKGESSPGDIKTPTQQELGNRFLRLPEYSSGGKLKRDPRSDLTLIVGILFYLITGKTPRQLTDENNLMPHQAFLKDNPNSNLVTQVRWSACSGIFDRGFRPNIEERFIDSQELGASLNEIFDQTDYASPCLRAFLVCEDITGLNEEDACVTLHKVADEFRLETFPGRLNVGLFVALGRLTEATYDLKITLHTPGFSKPATRVVHIRTGDRPDGDWVKKINVIIPVVRSGIISFVLSLGTTFFGPFRYPVRVPKDDSVEEFPAGSAVLQAFLVGDSIEVHPNETYTFTGVGNGFISTKFPVNIPLTYLVTVNNIEPGVQYTLRIKYPNGTYHEAPVKKSGGEMFPSASMVFSNDTGFSFNRPGVMNVEVFLNDRFQGQFSHKMVRAGN